MRNTLNRYIIRYRDEGDPGCPTFTNRVWAYDRQHAEEKFLDAPDADGWTVLSVEKDKAGMERQRFANA